MPPEDDFGRPITGVRFSLTDRCNLNCVYCHNEGLGDTRGPMASQDGEMTTAAVVRVLDVMHDMGVEAVKFTGGEPMLRQDLETIVRQTPDDMEVSLTTNGTFLPERARALADAGLDRVNVSLDALDPDEFAAITRSGAYEEVRAGIDAAVAAGITPVKLNVVVFEQTVDDVPQLVDHVASRPDVQLQLIEYMSEVAGTPEVAVDVARIHDWLAERADRVEHRDMHDRRRYVISAPDESDTSTTGMVEVVDAVENPTFCANCQRVRVTPDGQFRGCLNRPDDTHDMDTTSRASIRDAFRRTVANRLPYYGEYLREIDGEWVDNPARNQSSSTPVSGDDE